LPGPFSGGSGTFFACGSWRQVRRGNGSRTTHAVTRKGADMKLTPRQQRFVDEYLIDLNATQAAIRAGYSAKTAEQQGPRLLGNVGVAAAISAAQKARSARTEVDADYVLKRMIEIDQMDVLDIMDDQMAIKPVSEWPKVWRQYLSGFDLAEMFDGRGDQREMIGILKKIKWPDKVRNLELLGRHFGMFKERVEHSGEIKTPELKLVLNGTRTPPAAE
jgi:phage terminase small subunit